MNLTLKPLNEQVMVITGASSGIGLATARMAAKRGARLVLAARSGEDLDRLVEECGGRDKRAVRVQADVGNEADVRRIADTARAEFGGFDTWVNNAGGSVYGKASEVSIDDMRRVFDTNFWGVVYGSRIACESLRTRGGSLINVGSEVSERAIPLQGIYSASKAAVKGWTDALRMELETDKAPISVTLIKPAAIDTPFPEHAKNYLEDQPQHAPPVYTPDSVAEAILHAATTPVRDLFVGSAGKAIAVLSQIAPRLTDRLMELFVIPATHSQRPRTEREALHQAGGGLRAQGDYPGMVRSSVYTRASMHPALTSAALVGGGMLMRALLATGARRRARLLSPLRALAMSRSRTW